MANKNNDYVLASLWGVIAVCWIASVLLMVSILQ